MGILLLEPCVDSPPTSTRTLEVTKIIRIDTSDIEDQHLQTA